MALSRRQVALYVAQELSEGKTIKQLSKKIAAYLHRAKKTNEADFLMKDVQAILAKKYNTLSAQVISAHPLDDKQRQEIKSLIGKRENVESVQLEESIDKSLIGGFIIETPSTHLDASVLNKLQQLKGLN